MGTIDPGHGSNNQVRTVLYIEDDPEARFLMAEIIRYKGYNYHSASTGLEGISLAKKHKPDLILIDLILPDMQGNEVTTLLKSLPELKDTPIIAITADTRKDVKKMVLTAGCDGYIAKPINVSEFIYKIEEFLAGKKEHIEPESEKEYLQRYNVQLVSRLKKKISELEELNRNLQKLNEELFASREELARYNDHLFYLNTLANYLRTLHNPSVLIDLLPSKIGEAFQIERCVIFEIDRRNKEFVPLSLYGIPRAELEQFKVKYTDTINETFRQEDGILWIKDISEIVDEELLKFAKKMNSRNFILAHLSHLGIQQDSTSLLQNISQDEGLKTDFSSSKRLLIFLDKGSRGPVFATYEVRILKSFLQSVAVIYENMILYTRLIDLYKIKSQQAIRDGMTKVYNYRYFIQELQRETNRTMRFHTPFSLLMIDLDNFKQFNDRYGHPEGDKVLRKISQLLDEHTRSTDTVARYGGEEFAVILPGLQKKEAKFIAEKLRKMVEESNTGKKGKRNHFDKITISVGVASCPEDSIHPQILIELADQALYRAKRSGRNQVCTA